MMPAEMIYAAMKVYEWTEGVARKEMLEYELGRKPKKKRKFLHKMKNETMKDMVHRQVRLSTDA